MSAYDPHFFLRLHYNDMTWQIQSCSDTPWEPVRVTVPMTHYCIIASNMHINGVFCSNIRQVLRYMRRAFANTRWLGLGITKGRTAV